jgi:hypothetical protein
VKQFADFLGAYQAVMSRTKDEYAFVPYLAFNDSTDEKNKPEPPFWVKVRALATLCHLVSPHNNEEPKAAMGVFYLKTGIAARKRVMGSS